MTKILTGIVTSTKMQKTAVVEVERRFRHPLYRKVITRHKKYHAHNEIDKVQEGDVVKIKETKPFSKTKHFQVIEKVKTSQT